MSKRRIIEKDQLKKLYEKEKLNTYQIAELYNCCQGTIWKNLVKHNIKRRNPYELNSNVPSKEELENLYIEKKLSTWKIEEKYGYSRGTVHRKLKEYGFKTRDLADSHIIFPRKDFSGDQLEKAYLIGFRIGDLGVRKIHPNSKTICVASGSTIAEQIKLIKSLFENYGRVWIKKAKNNKINIQANLNMSFEFLLSKEIPKWIKRDSDIFFAFLAGFTDAEGWIGISKNMATYGLYNCNFSLLKSIKNILNKNGIYVGKILEERRNGKPTTDGYFFSSDYYQLRINRKKDLLNLFTRLKPYTKHENKIKALNSAIENINWRNAQYGIK